MKDHERLLRREEKKSIEAKPRGDESEEEFGAEHFAQLATDILTRCMDARDYEPIKVQNQIRDLALSYARLVPCRTVLSPTNPRPTAPVEREHIPSPRRASPRINTREVPSEVLPKKKVHYIDKDRLVLQRIRNGDIRDGHSTSFPDQGIRFDKDGIPWDKDDPNSCHHK